MKNDHPNKILILITYLIQFFWISVVFFTVYPLCNWFTSNRTHVFILCFKDELVIPFVPEFIWAYLSMFVLFFFPPFFLNPAQLRTLGKQLIVSTFMAGTIYVLIPTKLGFERIVPDAHLYEVIFEKMFAIDLPHNMLPSLHVIFSSLILYSLDEQKRKLRILWLIWLLLICLSTVFVHQHHILDIVTGLLVAFVIKCKITTRKKVS